MMMKYIGGMGFYLRGKKIWHFLDVIKKKGMYIVNLYYVISSVEIDYNN